MCCVILKGIYLIANDTHKLLACAKYVLLNYEDKVFNNKIIIDNYL